MDKISLQEYNKGKSNILKILFLIIGLICIFAGLFLNYKQETLICMPQNDMCYIEKINMVNTKKSEPLIKMSEIKHATYIPKNVQGNQYAKGYTEYFLIFKTKTNMNINIFSTEYFEKEEVQKIAQELNKKLKQKSERIIINRN